MNRIENTLLTCLRYIKDNNGEKKELPDCDVKKLYELMRRHGVELLLDHFVKLPRDIRIINKIEREARLKAYITMYTALKPVFSRLNERNISYAVTKGVFLASKAYPSIGDRKSGDIDILVDEVNLLAITEILNQEGFQQGYYDKEKEIIVPIDRYGELFFLTFSHQTATFRKIVNGMYLHYMDVDINRHILWGECKEHFKDISMNDFLRHSNSFFFEGVTFNVLSNEYGFIHIALHLYNDLNSLNILYTEKSYNLRGFSDIYLFIKNTPLNWAEINSFCQINDLDRYVYYVLSLTAQVFEDNTLLTLIEKPISYNNIFEESFGLSNDERKRWHHSLWERIFAEDKEVMLREYLDSEDVEKINFNKKFISANRGDKNL